MPTVLLTIVLLVLSNILMTFAWYGHLRFLPEKAIYWAILSGWGIAFFEYCLAVPANRIGYTVLTGFQLKIIQEIITIAVFSIFAVLVLGEKMSWNYWVSFALILLAAFFAFGFKSAT